MGNQPINQPNQPLTPSEWRALVGRCKGKTNKQIAIEAGTRENTIKSQVSSGLGRMGYGDKSQTPDDKIWWNKVGNDVHRRLLEEPGWRPAGATEDPPPLTQPVAAPLTPSPTPTLPPANMTITGRPSWRWIAGGLALAAVLSVLGFVLGRGQTQPQPVIPTSGPTATVRIERVAEKVTVPETVIVRETVPPVEVTVIVPQTVEVTSTPQPQQPTTTPEARAADAIASAPTAAPSPTIKSTPLALPFEDNFNLGLKPEWELVQGDPLIVNRYLTYRYETGPLVIRIGDANLNDYTLSFDAVDMVANPAIQISMGQEWRVNLTHVGASRVRVAWERLTDNGFQLVNQEDPDAARIVGRYQLQVAGDMFTLSFNGAVISEAFQQGVTNRGRIQISLNGGTATSAIDDFRLSSP